MIASKDMPGCHSDRNRSTISGNHTLCASPAAMSERLYRLQSQPSANFSTSACQSLTSPRAAHHCRPRATLPPGSNTPEFNPGVPKMSAASAVRIEADRAAVNRAAVNRAAVNRENAQFSTGPRTPEGKQRSSLNATSHGLTAKHPVLRSEDPQAYQEFCRNLIADLKPQGALEQQLAQNMADMQWRLLRCRSLEQSILTSEHQPSRQIESLAKFSLYEQRLTR